jgi:hypothetical protein
VEAWRAVAICGLIAAGGVIGLAGAIVSVTMVNAVNCKLPKEAQFEMWGWHAGKHLRLREEYRRLYPSGALLSRSYVLIATGLFCWIICAALLFRMM